MRDENLDYDREDKLENLKRVKYLNYIYFKEKFTYALRKQLALKWKK